jgi:hypothetical protein
MPNELCIAISQNKETFSECRIFLAKAFNSKDKVLELENAANEVALPYYIAYIEAKGIDFVEALTYFRFYNPDLKYSKLVIATVVNTFRKLEAKDLDFIPF